jgi:ATP-binding cassette subfamily B protein
MADGSLGATAEPPAPEPARETQRPSIFNSPRAFVAHYLKAHRWDCIGLVALVVSAGTCAVAIQYEMKVLVDSMAQATTNVSATWRALATFVSLVAFESLLWRLSGWMTCRTTLAAGVEIRLDLFKHLSKQPMRYFADNLAGSLGHRLTGTAGNFGALVNTFVWRILPPTVDFIGALVIFSMIDWHMAIAMGVYVVTITGALIAFGSRGRPLHSTYAGKSNHVSGDLTDVISNMWSVKAFSARQREWERLRVNCLDEAQAQRASWMYTEKTRVAYDVILWVMAGAMLAWAVYRWTTHSITPGDVVVVSALTFRILHGSRDVAIALVDVVQQFGYVEDTLKVLGEIPTIVDRLQSKSLRPRGGSIEFRRVSFEYEKSRCTLRDFDLYIPPGQKVGIVGPSGAGKSTLVHLIQRLYDPQQGSILIDSQPITDLKQDSLRDGLSVVPQEISLFHRTVMENIRFARPDASDAEVIAAAKAARCHEFVSRFPQGYDTLVGERGVKLSGGQRQRIGIARAFLKDAPIIILDEATSALDTESEMLIQQSIVERLTRRTVIAVAHRLSTLVNFERILVLVDGRIVEEGTVPQLRARNGVFERLWRLQTEGAMTQHSPAESLHRHFA